MGWCGWAAGGHTFAVPPRRGSPSQPLVVQQRRCPFGKTQRDGGADNDHWAHGAVDGELVLGATNVAYCLENHRLTGQWGSPDDPYYRVYERGHERAAALFEQS